MITRLYNTFLRIQRTLRKNKDNRMYTHMDLLYEIEPALQKIQRWI